METNKLTIWDEPMPGQLLRTLLVLESSSALERFLCDVMTEKEIREISTRLEAARLLSIGTPYTDIAIQTKLSSRTIARISDWMQNGCGGYKEALTHHAHSLPARAE